MKNLINLGRRLPYSLKFDLKMKLTVYLFLVSLFQIQASTYSQNTRITLNLKKVSVENVLKAIENKTEFKVLYNDRQVDYERVVSVNYKKAKVSEILKDLFAKTKINYEVLDKQIVLILDSNKRLLAEVEQQKTITGTVLDDGGMPLPGASVIVKGTNSGTTTDFDGNFSINVKGNNAVLLVSYVGFETKTVSVGSKSSITVSLNASAATLDEVVVVGYGSTKKSDLTGSVSVVKTKDIQKIAVTRVDDVLQGRTGGVQISKSSGAPGGNVNIRIRGTNSITGSNQPLVVIDDFIGGDLSTVDVNDVASIQVLKDASATAIYGSRASNGVIIVTTKKGSAGVQEVSFNTFVTAGKVLRKFDLMGAGQYAEQVNAQFEVFGKKLAFTQQEIDDFKEDGGTDWQDEIFRTGITSNYRFEPKGWFRKSALFRFWRVPRYSRYCNKLI
jgi:TonB-dependent SusC/RagA subfamily outer membrane receptor